MNTKNIITRVASTILIANFDNKIEVDLKTIAGLTESQLKENGWYLKVSPKQISNCLRKMGILIERKYHANRSYPIINGQIRNELSRKLASN